MQQHPSNGPLSETTRYQKSKINLDFTEARDSGLQWHQLDHMQARTSLQTEKPCQHATNEFLNRPDAVRATPTNSVRAAKAKWARVLTFFDMAHYISDGNDIT